jgi:hypothetical protein
MLAALLDIVLEPLLELLFYIFEPLISPGRLILILTAVGGAILFWSLTHN